MNLHGALRKLRIPIPTNSSSALTHEATQSLTGFSEKRISAIIAHVEDIHGLSNTDHNIATSVARRTEIIAHATGLKRGLINDDDLKF